MNKIVRKAIAKGVPAKNKAPAEKVVARKEAVRAKCGETCAGIFEPEPGHWGQRRMPITVQAKSANWSEAQRALQQR